MANYLVREIESTGLTGTKSCKNRFILKNRWKVVQNISHQDCKDLIINPSKAFSSIQNGW